MTTDIETKDFQRVHQALMLDGRASSCMVRLRGAILCTCVMPCTFGCVRVHVGVMECACMFRQRLKCLGTFICAHIYVCASIDATTRSLLIQIIRILAQFFCAYRSPARDVNHAVAANLFGTVLGVARKQTLSPCDSCGLSASGSWSQALFDILPPSCSAVCW